MDEGGDVIAVGSCSSNMGLYAVHYGVSTGRLDHGECTTESIESIPCVCMYVCIPFTMHVHSVGDASCVSCCFGFRERPDGFCTINQHSKGNALS